MSDQSTLSEFGVGDPPQTDQYNCGICGRSFDSKIGRGAHMPQKHNEHEIRTDLITELQSLAKELGRTPSQQHMVQQGKYAVGTYQKNFDSWNGALKEADLEINKHQNIAKQDLLNELTRFADELGGTPSKPDMIEQGTYDAGPYYRKFGSWNEALEEAGLEINMKETSERNILKPALLGELTRLADELERTPMRQDMKQQGKYSGSTYEREFGSWNEALKEAELEVNKEIEIAKQDLLNELTHLAGELGRTPIKQDMHQQGAYTSRPYYDKFGSWNEALREAGLEPCREVDIPESDLLTELAHLADELGRTPRYDDMNEKGKYSTKVYRTQFGSWNEALNEAGLELHVERNISKSNLLNELTRLADELGRTPIKQDMHQQGEYGTKVYRRQFGSWLGALDQAGLEHQQIKYPDDLSHKVRSTYEHEIANLLLDEGVEYEYESRVIEYGDNRTYTPDFVTDQYVIEVKGFTHIVAKKDQTQPDEIDKAEIAMEQLIDKQYVVIQGNGTPLPADIHIQWDERETLRDLF